MDNIKIVHPGMILLFKNSRLKGGDDSAIFLNLPKEVTFV